ncbi:MAG: hypothetical protein ABI969_09640 [bacterium]
MRTPTSAENGRLTRERLMGYRIFRDSRGTEWQTWDVVPRLEERRVNERRSRVAAPTHSERRSPTDRRILAGHRTVLTFRMGSGWLCFEAPNEKRRLSPIPADWQRCPSDRLEQYCADATPARRVTRDLQIMAVGE